VNVAPGIRGFAPVKWPWSQAPNAPPAVATLPEHVGTVTILQGDGGDSAILGAPKGMSPSYVQHAATVIEKWVTEGQREVLALPFPVVVTDLRPGR
jgi:hypothetical protein